MNVQRLPVRTILIGLALAAMAYFALFHQLDRLSLYRWDESTNALHAFEMWDSGNYLVRQYQGEPDHWETKPPLLTWMQVLSMRIVGFNELGVRLPSALAGLATLVMLVYFCWVDLERPAVAVGVAGALLSAQGYIRYHVTRTGDHDALLLWWLIWLLLSAFRYVHADAERQPRYLMFMAIALTLAVLTKSIGGFFWLPGIVLWLAGQRAIPSMLRSREMLWGTLGFLFIIGGYYLLREWQDPGYLYFVKENELFHRYLNTSVEYRYIVPQDRWLYVKMIMERDFAYVYGLIPLGLGMALVHPDERIKGLLQLCLWTAGIFLIVISFGTVHNWYHAPAIPLLAIIAGVVLGEGYTALASYIKIQAMWRLGMLAIIWYSVWLIPPYIQVLDHQVLNQQYMANDMMYGDAMALLERHHTEFKDYHVVYREGNRHAQFYLNVYNQTRGYQIEACAAPQDAHMSPCTSFQLGDQVLLCKPEYIRDFESRYQYDRQVTMAGCILYLVKGFVPPQPE